MSRHLLALAGAASLGLATAAQTPDYRQAPGGTTKVPGRFHVRLTTNDTVAADLAAKLAPGRVWPNVLAAELHTTLNSADFNTVMSHSGTGYIQDAVLLNAQATASDTPTREFGHDATDFAAGTWHLDMLDGTADGKFTPAGKEGDGVDIYVFDSGVDVSLPQLTGRASNFFSAVGGNFTDVHGHGTAAAAIIAAVAPKAAIKSVRVAQDHGRTLSLDLAAGVSHVIATADTTRPRVAYLPLATPSTGAYNNAVLSLSNAGFHIITSAFAQPVTGGSSSPATMAASGAILTNVVPVGPDGKVLVRSSDGRPMASIGPANEITAPGLNIKTVTAGGKVAYLTGSSAAAAQVAGIAALITSHYPAVSQAELKETLLSTATKATTNPLGDGEIYPPRIASTGFDMGLLCKSRAPTVSSEWCRATQCDGAYRALCEVTGRQKAATVCRSLVAHIPDAWCQQVNCNGAYSALCQLQCST